MENNNAYHHAVLTKKLYDQALEELNFRMKLDKKIKLFSSLGSRATFGLSCLDLIKDNQENL